MISKYSRLICIFVLISVLAINGGSSEQEAPQRKFGQNAPTMTFLYW